MTSTDLKKGLRALVEDDKKRTKMARFREVYAEVEAALEAGISQADVVETLNKNGLELTLGSFRTLLKRIRDSRQKTGGALPSGTKPTSAPAPRPAPRLPDPPAEEEEEESQPPSHDPQIVRKHLAAQVDLEALSKANRK